MSLALVDEWESILKAARQSLRDGNTTTAALYQRWFHEETERIELWPSAAAYQSAIADPTRFEQGWMVMAKTADLAGSVLVQRNGRQRLVAPPEVVPEDPRRLALALDQNVLVDALACSETNGFWTVWSASWQANAPENFLRLYFRVPPSRALTFAHSLVKHLPLYSVWAMKMLSGLHDAGRRDNAVMYVPVGTALESGWLLCALRAVADLCVGQIPPFVRLLYPGIGWAHDPGDGRSFGEAVSEAVASAAGLIDDPLAFAAEVSFRVRTLPSMAGTEKQ